MKLKVRKFYVHILLHNSFKIKYVRVLVVHYSLSFTAYKAASGGVFLRCGILSLGYNCTSWPCAKMVSTNTFHTYLKTQKKSLHLSLSSIITFFSSLSFSSIAFLQLNSIAFLLIPISPPCSLPHQHEHSRSCLMK